ncbi:hypothetical protein NADFUDRAFT_29601 [Nadsonia fulvescens var. elongata DSM 6958]|uniref:Uncharacterized protein n=1 Tax=Nadsonia fulvescens var. elongata DSM 6958 TaxID=857566 RepID=A0A1E3PR36_9ASCO|nr:hypothetical protein NADFUDRAFT_29601 [Nadsonia fulvescens var. elongata DSM 6958]
MVSEYAVEIFDYLYSLETKYMPNPRYMDDQSDLDWKMRGVLVDWLVEVHTKFRLLPETLFLAVNIVDRFMSVRVITLEKVQLVGIASMIIAAKIEEVFAPSVQNYVYIADNGYEQKEVLKAEKCILEVLNFDFSYPNPMNFLRRISKADNYDVQTRTIAKYLLEIGLVDHRLMPYKTSKVAAASMYMARMMLKRGDWNDNLVHYSGDYTESDLIDVVNALLSYLTEPVTHEAFFKKYASKRFLKASIIARKWAHETVGAGANAEGW